MSKIAVISDIHGNVPALDVVLDDIRRRGCDEIICLGDLAGKGPYSAEAVDIIRDVCDIVVLGNWDVTLAEENDHPAVRFWQEQLGSERRAYLGSLPFCHDMTFGGRSLRFYHASQKSVHFRVFPFSDNEIHAALFNNSEATGNGRPDPDTIIYGDIHAAYLLPFQRRRLILNAGSVGNPLDQPLATYIMLSGHKPGESINPLDIEFIRLEYDKERTIAHAQAIDMPATEALAQELRTAVYRGAST